MLCLLAFFAEHVIAVLVGAGSDDSKRDYKACRQAHCPE
jgi:hypothetical protein